MTRPLRGRIEAVLVVLALALQMLSCRDAEPTELAELEIWEDFDRRWADAERMESSDLVLGDPVDCSEPSAEVRYLEAAEDWGLKGGEALDPGAARAGTAVVHDFDGDGELDIVLG